MVRLMSFAMLACVLHSAALASEDAVGRKLQSSLIWSSSVPAGKQAYVAFHKRFEMREVPSEAMLHLFADSRYMLWVNGRYVLRGPCRFNPKRPEYDSVDVSPFLQKGSNVMAVLVHHYAGAVNGRIIQHDPGLALRLDVGGKEKLSSDPSWRCSAQTRYQPSPGAWSSIPDVIDGRVERDGDWTGAAFEGAAWENAVPVDGGKWGMFQPRGIPLSRERDLAGLKLLPSGRELAAAFPLELDAGQEVIVDLGRMAMAYAVADVDADEGSVLQIQYALRFENGRPGEMYGVGTTYTARGGRQSFMAGDQWCSHYMTVRCALGKFKLFGLKMIDRRYPFERLGRFKCSDEALTRLWEASVNTIETVTDDGYGSDARERDEWLQDPAQPNFITTRIAEAAPQNGGKLCYSDPRLIKNLLRHAALAQLPDGRIPATFPTDRGAEDCHHFIDDYACQWVEALKLYFDATGDRDFVREMWPALTSQVKWFLEHRTPRGLYLGREYASFDNPLAYITCEGATVNAYLYQALLDSAYLAGMIDAAEQSDSYAQAAKELYAAYNRHFWNEADSAYFSGFLGDKLLGPTAHAQLLALNRGLVPDSRLAGVRKWFLATYKNPGGFHCGGNPDFEKMIAQKAGVNMPVVYYWVFQELYRMNSAEADMEAIGEMRRRWAGTLEISKSTGTVMEGFGELEGCHNYGAVPAYFLSSYVLGVRLDGPVWRKRILIEPRMGDLESAEGVVMTEFGPVPVSWKKIDGGKKLAYDFKVPKGVHATVRLLKLSDVPNLTLNGKALVRQGHARKGVRIEGRWIVVNEADGACSGEIVP